MGDQNQNINNDNTAEQQEKTFTQEQLNSIVGKRLAEQKQQLEADFVKRTQDLDRREMSIRAKELLAEKGLPKNLADILRYENEAELVKAIETIEHTKGIEKPTARNQYKVLGDNRLPTGIGDKNIGDPIAKTFGVTLKSK